MDPAEWTGAITCLVLLVITAWGMDRVDRDRKRGGRR